MSQLLVPSISQEEKRLREKQGRLREDLGEKKIVNDEL
jgi:hypothetical protein